MVDLARKVSASCLCARILPAPLIDAEHTSALSADGIRRGLREHGERKIRDIRKDVEGDIRTAREFIYTLVAPLVILCDNHERAPGNRLLSLILPRIPSPLSVVYSSTSCWYTFAINS